LISPAFLYRFCVSCQYTKSDWSARGVKLDEHYTIPSFYAELDQGPRFADLRIGWNETGLLIWLRTLGKKQAPWCRESRLEDSDGLSLMIDTRDTHSIHRAGRFCHRFVFLPQGAGRMLNEPVAQLAEIPRAREHPKPAPRGSLQVLSEKRIDGYVLHGRISAEALTGFDPAEHPRLGFSYAVIDRESGWQTFSVGPEFPFLSDPSLWGTLELAQSEDPQ
jgi:hypothetical protein